GLVRLEHRELRRVRRVRALVAEVAVDLEDLLHAADDRLLEEDLGRDAQEQLEVVCIHVRRERPRGGAGRNGLQHRRLDLEKAAAVEVLAQRAHDTRAQPHHVAGRGARDEVDVALAHAGLLREVLVQHRQRAQRLGGHAPLVGEDAQLAAPRRADPAVQAASASSPTSARLSMPWRRLPSPSCSVTKQSLPPMRTKTTRPATPTTSSVSWPASRCPWDARTSAIEWVTGTDTGYASTPLASSRSRFSRRTRSCSGRSSVGGAAVSSAAGFWLTESILSRPPTSFPRRPCALGHPGRRQSTGRRSRARSRTGALWVRAPTER